jgi:hypothetical protein
LEDQGRGVDRFAPASAVELDAGAKGEEVEAPKIEAALAEVVERPVEV